MLKDSPGLSSLLSIWLIEMFLNVVMADRLAMYCAIWFSVGLTPFMSMVCWERVMPVRVIWAGRRETALTIMGVASLFSLENSLKIASFFWVSL